MEPSNACTVPTLIELTVGSANRTRDVGARRDERWIDTSFPLKRSPGEISGSGDPNRCQLRWSVGARTAPILNRQRRALGPTRGALGPTGGALGSTETHTVFPVKRGVRPLSPSPRGVRTAKVAFDGYRFPYPGSGSRTWFPVKVRDCRFVGVARAPPVSGRYGSHTGFPVNEGLNLRTDAASPARDEHGERGANATSTRTPRFP